MILKKEGLILIANYQQQNLLIILKSFVFLTHSISNYKPLLLVSI